MNTITNYNTKYINMLIMGIFLTFSFSQDWESDYENAPFDNEFSANIAAAQVFIDGVEQTSGKLAAFGDDGVISALDADGADFFPPGGTNVYDLSVWSNSAGEVMTFKFMKDDGDIIDLNETYAFVINDVVGDGFFPFQLTGSSPDCGEGPCDDLDADGICDDVDDCVGEYDDCEVCNGDGSSCLCEDVDCTFLDTQCITGSCMDGECIPVYHENGFSCDDNILCTVNDSCDGDGSCGGIIMSCDDGNPCTEDICDGSGGCIYNYYNGLPCDDGNQCTISDVCNEGVCLSGQQMMCDDSIGCTIDTCDSQLGCIHTPDDSFCDDGNPCIEYSCDEFGGCTYNYSNGLPCDDGDQCTESDTCNEGSCSGTVIPNCP